MIRFRLLAFLFGSLTLLIIDYEAASESHVYRNADAQYQESLAPVENKVIALIMFTVEIQSHEYQAVDTHLHNGYEYYQHGG